MTTGIFSTGISGLQVAQLGLLTTEHNISNANTAGFTRQRIVQASNIAMLTGSGYVGQGAHVSTVERMYDSFLAGQVTRTQSASSALSSYYSQISQIDNMLADSSSGISPALQDFFAGVQQLASDPSQLSSRQAMISSAQALVSRYQALDGQVSQMYSGINSQLTTTVSTINSYAEQIAALNTNIIQAGSAINQPPNDLMDQRDQLVLELNKLVQTSTTTNTDGSYNVYIGSGQQLVTSTRASKLAVVQAAEDLSRLTIGLQTAGGVQKLPESLISGGTLGGLLEFRSGSLDSVANELGRNAASLALTFNAQNALGQDLLGQSAGANFVANFFTLPSPTVLSNSSAVVTADFAAPSIDGYYSLSHTAAGYTLTRQSDGTQWPNSGASATLADLQNVVPASEGLSLSTGNITLAVGENTQVLSAAAAGANFYTNLTGSDYRLSYVGTTYTLTRLDNNTVVGSDTDLDVLSGKVAKSEGFSLKLASGTPTSGDTFLIQPTRTAARNLDVSSAVAADARLVAAAMPIRTTAASSNTGNGTISEGQSLNGFVVSTSDPNVVPFPANGVTLTYSGGNKLSIDGLNAGTKISALMADGSVNVYDSPAQIDYASGVTISFANVSFQIVGSLNTGDTFSVARNSAGVSDGRNALALGQLQTQNTMTGKTASFQSAYAQMVSNVGNKSREINVKSTAQAALLTQAQNARDALSGVNLDEEAANLMLYQQAYQASAKMLEIGSKLFDTVLSILA